jgi:hypothetical protein
MTDTIFPVLVLNGRPGAGKSEITDFLRRLPDEARRTRFHIGHLCVLDDFPMLWTWLEEDDLLEKELGRPRLHTTPDGYFIHHDLWRLLIERLGLEYAKLVRDTPDLHATHTVLVEFSRGSEHGGYRAAYNYLSEAIVQRAAILYIDVPYEESFRKNRRRFNPNRPDSILEHGLPDARLERLYKEVDWVQLTAGNPEFIPVRGTRVPYAVFSNHDDVTTSLGPVFEERLQSTLGTLWERWARLHKVRAH